MAKLHRGKRRAARALDPRPHMTGSPSASTHPSSIARPAIRAHSIKADLATALIALAGMALSTMPAQAINADVKSACTSDYFKHCSQHAVGSGELRLCMRKVGEDLSTPCLVALVKAGEVTKAEIEAYKAKQASPSAPPKKAAEAAAKPSGSPAKAAKVAEPAKSTASAKSLARVKAAKAKNPTNVASAKAKGLSPAKTAVKAPAVAKGKPAAASFAKSAPASAIAPTKTAKPYRPATATPGSPVPQVAGWASPGANAGAPPAYTHNLCRATTLAGEVETFTCGLDERCCYGALFNEKYCVPLSKSCF